MRKIQKSSEFGGELVEICECLLWWWCVGVRVGVLVGGRGVSVFGEKRRS